MSEKHYTKRCSGGLRWKPKRAKSFIKPVSIVAVTISLLLMVSHKDGIAANKGARVTPQDSLIIAKQVTPRAIKTSGPRITKITLTATGYVITGSQFGQNARIIKVMEGRRAVSAKQIKSVSNTRIEVLSKPKRRVAITVKVGSVTSKGVNFVYSLPQSVRQTTAAKKAAPVTRQAPVKAPPKRLAGGKKKALKPGSGQPRETVATTARQEGLAHINSVVFSPNPGFIGGDTTITVTITRDPGSTQEYLIKFRLADGGPNTNPFGLRINSSRVVSTTGGASSVSYLFPNLGGQAFENMEAPVVTPIHIELRTNEAGPILLDEKVVQATVHPSRIPNLISPASGTDANVGTQLQWFAVYNAHHYQLCLSRAASTSGCDMVKNLGNVTSFLLDLESYRSLAGQEATWSIRACAANASCWPSSERRSIRMSRPEPPNLTAPSTGTVIEAGDQLSWTTADTQRYRLCFEGNDCRMVTATSWPMTDDIARQYASRSISWHVQSCVTNRANAQVCGNPSGSRSIRLPMQTMTAETAVLAPPPIAITAFTIDNGATATMSRTVRLNWTATGLVEAYRVSENPSFAGAGPILHEGAGPNSLDYPFSTNAPGPKTIYLQVEHFQGANGATDTANASITYYPDGQDYVINATQLLDQPITSSWTHSVENILNSEGVCTRAGPLMTAQHANILAPEGSRSALCRYTFFIGRRRLNAGWTVKSVNITGGDYNVESELSVEDLPLAVGTDQLLFSVRFKPRNRVSASAARVFSTLILNGPPERNWREAFE